MVNLCVCVCVHIYVHLSGNCVAEALQPYVRDGELCMCVFVRACACVCTTLCLP